MSVKQKNTFSLSQGQHNSSVTSRTPDLLDRTLQLTEHFGDTYTKNDRKKFIKQGFQIVSGLQHLGCDQETLSAGLLFPTFAALPLYTTAIVLPQIEAILGTSVKKLLMGTQQMAVIDKLSINNAEFSQQTGLLDNAQKMILAMVDDIRIVLIKLAERLMHLKNLSHESLENQKNHAQKAMELYAPLANQLGIGHLKWQIEDSAFRYLDPENYTAISKSINMRREERETYLNQFIEKFKGILQATSIKKITFSGRAKHIYSIYCKIQKKQVSFDEIYDALAVRILTTNIEDCYSALSTIHATWEPIPKEFDDYIAKPKPNGYRSIHTAIVGPQQHHIEIQIRTLEMHQESERGVAAHWKYKQKNKTVLQHEEKINWLRALIHWQKEVASDSKMPDILYKKIVEDRVYAFTPTGDLLNLPAGATPLDFAYYVHTEIGHRCRGAKVNGKITTLTEPLKTGDRVEILTVKIGDPSRDWLNPSQGYLKTPLAKAKVRHWIRQKDQKKNKFYGLSIWEKSCRKSKWSKNDLNKIYKSFNFSCVDDLLIAIGSGHIGMSHVLNRLSELETKDNKKLDIEEPETRITRVIETPTHPQTTHIQADNLLTQLARCCQPIPGDPIVGYITKNRGIMIHHQHCSNVQHSMMRRIERIMHIDWNENMPKRYAIHLIITAENRSDLIRDVSTAISNHALSILRLRTYEDNNENLAHIDITLDVTKLEMLGKIITSLRQVPTVLQVQRKI